MLSDLKETRSKFQHSCGFETNNNHNIIYQSGDISVDVAVALRLDAMESWSTAWRDPLLFVARKYPIHDPSRFEGTIFEPLATYWYHQLFPDEWHLGLNMLVLSLEFVVIVWCIIERRVVARELQNAKLASTPPKPSSSTKQPHNIAINQTNHAAWVRRVGLVSMFTMLTTHSTFYILELTFTSLMTQFPPMALHHILALAIFLAIALEPQSISIVIVAPFIGHATVWLTDISNLHYLMTYNCVLLAAGITFLAQPGWHRGAGEKAVVTPVLGVLAIMTAATNYFTYCWGYLGTVCPPRRAVWIWYDFWSSPDIAELKRRAEFPFVRDDAVTGWEWVMWCGFVFGMIGYLSWTIGVRLGRRGVQRLKKAR
ncbi:hypothetical protein BJ742DRAFT_895395 [Cladochytrium replicatum]|nr:hypothetical protein BJ742DRAFT_895395 [Cladochytrium replicatum]